MGFSPSRKVIFGSQPRSSLAREMSGLRTFGSSAGRSFLVIRRPCLVAAATSAARQRSAYHRARDWLQARRIRIHLVSGVEFEMFVFIIGPLTGWVVGTTIVAGALLLLMEAALVGRMWIASRKFAVQIAALEGSAAGPDEPVIPRLTPLRG